MDRRQVLSGKVQSHRGDAAVRVQRDRSSRAEFDMPYRQASVVRMHILTSAWHVGQGAAGSGTASRLELFNLSRPTQIN